MQKTKWFLVEHLSEDIGWIYSKGHALAIHRIAAARSLFYLTKVQLLTFGVPQAVPQVSEAVWKFPWIKDIGPGAETFFTLHTIVSDGQEKLFIYDPCLKLLRSMMEWTKCSDDLSKLLEICLAA